MKEKQLQKQAKILQEELETLWMIKQGFEVPESRERASICWEATPQPEKEKRVLTCRVTGHNQTCENDSKRKDGEISERKHR
ncbi:hypothetical protein Nepgr_012154 [Nepenthes gracilis]|uniref:Uncharacterized protein n=1 Tax=Nepenthes gracilis TaxID=150966 RepID=A0AAD3SFK6_NEPGR|nr:hypothetical protein Nepgr_012154 [Nepenthes gracilis]